MMAARFIMRHIGFIILAVFLLSTPWAFFPAVARETPDRILSVRDAQKLLKDNGNILILDVRTPGEYGEGHLPGAQNLDFFGPVFEMELNKLDRDRAILVYCQTGRRSDSALQMMEKAGFKNVHDLKGGFKAWKGADLPVEQ